MRADGTIKIHRQIGLVHKGDGEVLFSQRSRPAHMARRFVQSKTALAGACLITAMVLAALMAPALSPHDPNEQSPFLLQGPSSAFPLGTDSLGRDLLSRLLHGARPSLGIAALAGTLITLVGVILGTCAGYLGGFVDNALMRVVDVLQAFPTLLLSLAIVGILGVGLPNVVIGIVGVWWADYARLTRSLVLEARTHGYVEAAQAIGVQPVRIAARHVIPNILSPIIVLASLEMGALILVIASLSFLGLGAQPPQAEWGAMLNEGRLFFLSAPQMMLYPGVLISLTVLGFNLLGDGLRDVLDPRLR